MTDTERLNAIEAMHATVYRSGRTWVVVDEKLAGDAYGTRTGIVQPTLREAIDAAVEHSKAAVSPATSTPAPGRKARL